MTSVTSMWRIDIKCKYRFLFPLKNLACKGLSYVLRWMYQDLMIRFNNIFLSCQDTLFNVKTIFPGIRIPVIKMKRF